MTRVKANSSPKGLDEAEDEHIVDSKHQKSSHLHFDKKKSKKPREFNITQNLIGSDITKLQQQHNDPLQTKIRKHKLVRQKESICLDDNP